MDFKRHGLKNENCENIDIKMKHWPLSALKSLPFEFQYHIKEGSIFISVAGGIAIRFNNSSELNSLFAVLCCHNRDIVDAITPWQPFIFYT